MSLYECPKCKNRERQTPVCRICDTDLTVIGEDPAYEAGRQSRQDEVVAWLRVQGEFNPGLLPYADALDKGAK